MPSSVVEVYLDRPFLYMLVDRETNLPAFIGVVTANKAARDAMVRYRVHACTDVTGFGLLLS